MGGDNAIAHATETPTRLVSKIDGQKMGKPAVMAILTAVGRYAYRRHDGILVVLISCLKD